MKQRVHFIAQENLFYKGPKNVFEHLNMPSIYCEGKLFFVYVCKNIIDFLFFFSLFFIVFLVSAGTSSTESISCKTLCLFFSAMLGIIVLVHNPIETEL